MVKFVAVLALVILVAGEVIGDIDGVRISAATVIITLKSPFRTLHGPCCSGAIISSKFVLTSPSCVRISHGWEQRVQTVSANGIIEEKFHTVERVIEHNGYSAQDGVRNNIALLKVNPPFEIDQIRAKIPLSEKQIPVGTTATAVTLMYPVFRHGTYSKELHAVKAKVISRCKYTYNYGDDNTHSEDQIYTRYTGRYSFENYLLGSPLIINKTQVGILSFARGSRDRVYTLVAKYKSWIRSHVPDT